MTGRVSSSLARLDGLTSLKIGGNPDLGGPLPLSLSALSLRDFHYADTGLCISPARSFSEWLGDNSWPGVLDRIDGSMGRCRPLIRLYAPLSAWPWPRDAGAAAARPAGARECPSTTVTVSPATVELAALGATVQLTAVARDQNNRVMAGAT